MKLISLFNHKGGVSKTTTAFNLGWVLAEQGHKTLIVDADPQCNLTALVLDYNSVEEVEDFYADNPGCDLSAGLEPVMAGKLTGLSAGNPAPTSNENLFLYCGNLALSEIETQVSVALTTSTAIPAIKNLPGSIGELLRITGQEHGFEYIIVDMSPSVGALNECLLMASDYFIVPTAPDFFCAQAIRSLSSVVPKWNSEVAPFRDPDVDYQLPQDPPKFIGFISQRYRPRSGAPAKSFQRWIDVIKETVSLKLIPALEPIGMAISQDSFAKYSKTHEPYNLANVADFNSLIAQSQKFNVPVFALTDEQLEQAGVIEANMKESRDKFREVFEQLASEIHTMTDNV
ncbi:ParA family protein [Gammaproteobacteria bacterium AB-CW1]|uniref:ParA family protein n=1 Tax=Natronospira elongata TaxID=3110268 RepID=A0AAP6JFI8_9GAMM|nr:ParA family protein [Gammaproteobacteria bacterium AB-CW1]